MQQTVQDWFSSLGKKNKQTNQSLVKQSESGLATERKEKLATSEAFFFFFFRDESLSRTDQSGAAFFLLHDAPPTLLPNENCSRKGLKRGVTPFFIAKLTQPYKSPAYRYGSEQVWCSANAGEMFDFDIKSNFFHGAPTNNEPCLTPGYSTNSGDYMQHFH